MVVLSARGECRQGFVGKRRPGKPGGPQLSRRVNGLGLFGGVASQDEPRRTVGKLANRRDRRIERSPAYFVPHPVDKLPHTVSDFHLLHPIDQSLDARVFQEVVHRRQSAPQIGRWFHVRGSLVGGSWTRVF